MKKLGKFPVFIIIIGIIAIGFMGCLTTPTHTAGCPGGGGCSVTHTWNPATETWSTSTNIRCSRSMCDARRSAETPWHGTFRCNCR